MENSILKNRLFKMTAVLVAIAVLSAAVAVIAAPSANTVNAAEGANTSIITVTGKASVRVEPDIAYVSLGVVTRDAAAQKAQADNAEVMTKVMAALKALGIDEKDISTANYYIYQEYDYSLNRATIIGYNVSNHINVTVRNIGDVSKVIDSAVAAGANMGGSVSFSVANPEAAYNLALTQAVRNARNKGSAIAAEFGVTLGKPASVTEMGSWGIPSIMTDFREMAGGMDASFAPMATSTPISPRDLEISATVEVQFRY
jgi:hypothetical protein